MFCGKGTVCLRCVNTASLSNALSLHMGFLSFSGSLIKLGACMNRYWQQKKAMAPGCEPATVRTMMEALQPVTLGQSLAGAGGGGFLFILTQHGQQEENVRRILSNIQVRERERETKESDLKILKIFSFQSDQ